MTRKYHKERIVWRDITIEIRYCSKWLPRDIDGFNIAHLEIEAINPDRARLPMTKTGYHSHFGQHADIAEHGGPVDYVTAWLEHESQSKQWLDYVERSRQGELF
jgi:hypothetical protein